jgi:hypothetical protein
LELPDFHLPEGRLAGPRLLEFFLLRNLTERRWIHLGYSIVLAESSHRRKRKRISSIEELAECLSRYSNRPSICELKFNVTNAWTSLAVLLICSFFEYWETEKVYRHIAQLAYSRNYEGRWKEVQEILETRLQGPKEYLEKFLEQHSSEEFYGNLLPFAGNLAQMDFLRDLEHPRQRKLKVNARHRGYRDKGTYRFSHERHGDPVPRAEHQQDRRSLVAHPLINYDFEDEMNFKLRDVPASTSQERRNFRNDHTKSQ